MTLSEVLSIGKLNGLAPGYSFSFIQPVFELDASKLCIFKRISQVNKIVIALHTQ
jgi:hypothetical protein